MAWGLVGMNIDNVDGHMLALHVCTVVALALQCKAETLQSNVISGILLQINSDSN